MTIRVAVVGATGRMGRLAVEIIDASADLKLHAAVDSKSGLDRINGADVAIDFTRFDVSERVAAHCIEARVPLVIGTSGWSANHLKQLENQLAAGGTVLVIPNFSIGSMLATQFATLAARYFESIEIVEAHHAGKVDSPSGTAQRTAELIHRAREGLTQPLLPGVGQPARGQVVAGIPIHSLRLAGVSALQEVHFGAGGELLTIRHETSSLQAYSFGILSALRVATTAKGLIVGLQHVLEYSLEGQA